MKTDELREKYLDFFSSKGCVRKPSDVLVPHGDPTVLFTPAGMNQFKNQFLGIGPLEFTAATTCQKCLRTGDIENVGNTAYHHTFFEMLGNFSFGDYFKKEAIHWAWEFLTSKSWLGLDRDRLTVTVYLDDDEAFGIWNKEIGLAPNRISREDEGENFWPASAPSQGPDGVCGPCSEIYYHRPDGSGKVEIWNLVFTQFNRVGSPPNNLQPLPKKNIDTGMGLERTASVLQGFESNFEIDTLRPLCLAVAETVGVDYSFSAPQGRPVRRIADHVRAVTFCIHENTVPGNEKQGYVVRQLLRRAVLEGYLLGRQDPFLFELVPAVATAMQVPYPELRETIARVQHVIKAEEEYFLRTVDRGLRKLERCIESARKQGLSQISGEDAFDLHQTDGFLLELSDAFAVRNNLSVDRVRFRELMQEHQARSGKDAFESSVMRAGPMETLQQTAEPTVFLGYETTAATGKIVGIVAKEQLVESIVEVGHADPIAVILDRTPFYAKAGGQVGDIGTIMSDTGAEFEVVDTQKKGPFSVHYGHLKTGRLTVGTAVTATVDADRRAAIRRAHSATHLLHHALQTTLGSHATQKGSNVDADVLRFDFTQPKAISPEDLQTIENIINEKVQEGAAISAAVMPQEEAKKSGAMALFGEKYPDMVRVISMGDFSKELCGGTHLHNTGQVGLCRIIAEESVAAGIRRITAITGMKALEKTRHDESMLVEIARQLKAPRVEDIASRLGSLLNETRDLKLELNKFMAVSAAGLLDELLAKAQKIAGVSYVTHLSETLDADGIRAQIDELRRRAPSFAAIVGSSKDGKVLLVSAFSKDVVDRGLSAVDWVKAAAKAVGGGGGGRADMAQAGGKFVDKLPQAITDATTWLTAKLG